MLMRLIQAFNLPYEDEIWSLIFCLLNRSWFQRLWIVQEIRLANGEAVVLCVYETIRWGTLRNTALCLQIKRKDHKFSELIHLVERVFQLCDVFMQPSLTTLLNQTKRNLCSDQRDRIYALTNMVRLSESIVGIKPSYSKTTRKLFQDVVLRYLEREWQLHFLASYGKHAGLGLLPTWVPSWTNPNSCTEIWAATTNACSMSKAEAQYAGDGILQVTRTYLATIKQVENTLSANFSSKSQEDKFSDVLEAIRRVVRPIFGSCPYPGGDSMEEALCRTFSYNYFAENAMPQSLLEPDFPQRKEDFRSIVELGDGVAPLLTINLRRYLVGVVAAVSG